MAAIYHADIGHVNPAERSNFYGKKVTGYSFSRLKFVPVIKLMCELLNNFKGLREL
jgi:hypothetical protein